MYLLLSGEGSSDIGCCIPSSGQCDGTQFRPGPMAIFIDQLVDQQIDQQSGYNFSHLSCERVGFVSESYLVENKLPPKSQRKNAALRGKKKRVETQHYYQNARALAAAAKEKAEQVEDKVIAVLFRDGDGTASAGRGSYDDKVASMLKGFEDEGYGDLGVPMMPNPKSEAWLLCAVKENPYQHCRLLENESGNDNSQRVPLKTQLDNALAVADIGDNVVDMIKDHQIDVSRIDMPSFERFKRHLNNAISHAS